MPADIESSVAQVKAHAEGESQGLAFPLGRRHVVTCAHVVNNVLPGRASTQWSPPGRCEVWLHFPLVRADRRAHLVHWHPREEHPRDEPRDVAVLETDEPLPRRVVRPRLRTYARRGKSVYMFGPAAGRAFEVNVRGTVMGETEKGVQVNLEPKSSFPDLGFSGGPAWYPWTGRVVGMLLGRGHSTTEPRDVYLVPAKEIVAAWQDQRGARLRSRIGGVLHPLASGVDERRPRVGRRVRRFASWSSRELRTRLPSWELRAALACGVGGFLFSRGLGFPLYLAADDAASGVLPRVDPVATVPAAGIALMAAVSAFLAALGTRVVRRWPGAQPRAEHRADEPDESDEP